MEHRRLSPTASPPVQPSSSSTSGTGSVRTMWLEATAQARAGGPRSRRRGVDGEHRGPARTVPPPLSATASVAPSRRRGCARGAGHPPRAAGARSPSERRAGCTFAACGRSAPPRKSGEAQRRTHLGRVDAAPPPRARRPPRRPRRASSQSPSCASDVATSASAPRRTRRRPPALAPRADPAHRALGRAATSTARASPTRSRRVGRSSQSVDTKPPLRPLGPWPQRPASRRTTSAPARAPSGATPSTGRGSRRRRRGRRRVCPVRAGSSARRRRGLLEPPAVSRMPQSVTGAILASGYPASARGGGSSAGRAPGRGPGGRGFESRPPPLLKALETGLSASLQGQRRAEPERPSWQRFANYRSMAGALGDPGGHPSTTASDQACPSR